VTKASLLAQHVDYLASIAAREDLFVDHQPDLER
jgi:hypothetical protein